MDLVVSIHILMGVGGRGVVEIPTKSGQTTARTAVEWDWRNRNFETSSLASETVTIDLLLVCLGVVCVIWYMVWGKLHGALGIICYSPSLWWDVSCCKFI